MPKFLLSNVVRFFALLLLQILLLNQMDIHRWATPFIYVLFPLLLPISTPRPLVLLLAFVIGIIVDIFSNTVGIHAAATVFMAYARHSIIAMLTPPGDYDELPLPNIPTMGFRWFLIYASVAIFIHHFVYFALEYSNLSYIYLTFIKAFFSTALTLSIAIVGQYLFASKD